MRRLATLALAVGMLAVSCGGDAPPWGGARTYFESLELGSPVSAVETFVEAFQRDDFMTVWLVLDRGAQFRFRQCLDEVRYDCVMRTDLVGDLDVEIEGVFSPQSAEGYDLWYHFDQLMLIAQRHDAFLIDLSGEVILGGVNTGDGTAVVSADVEGIDGEVEFRLTVFPAGSGRWRVHQVVVPGGDEQSIPWSVPPGSG
jgi:hypothetical protein